MSKHNVIISLNYLTTVVTGETDVSIETGETVVTIGDSCVAIGTKIIFGVLLLENEQQIQALLRQ